MISTTKRCIHVDMTTPKHRNRVMPIETARKFAAKRLSDDKHKPNGAAKLRRKKASPTINDKLDINQLGARVRAEDAGRWGYTPGRGWFERVPGGLWRRDIDALALRGRVQGLIDGGIARPGTRARFVLETIQPAFAIDGDRWDSDPNLAGLPDNRILDLRTCEAIEAGDSFVSRRLGVMPEEGEPTEWLRFLWDTFGLTGEAEDVVSWLRWWFKYSLSGDCRDESLICLFGPRGTGKSTIAETWSWVMGGYGATVPGERLTSNRGTHRQWIANLAGARLVVVNELPDGGRWQTSDLNALVSGEPITANFMQRGDFTFRSQAHVIVVGNHRPGVSAQSGFWRRIRLLECRNVPRPPDDNLKVRLRTEAGRILRWALDSPDAKPDKPAGMDGCIRAYMEETDHFAAWLNECVEFDASAFEPTSALAESYFNYARRERIDPPMQQRKLENKLTEVFGAAKDRKVRRDGASKNRKCRNGARLRPVAGRE